MTAASTTLSATADEVHVEVIYARPERQDRVALRLSAGATLEQAIIASGLLDKYPELELARLKTGIYGKLCKLDSVLHERDRVEIYRPLIADPKEVRKQRAAEGKVMKKGGAAEA